MSLLKWMTAFPLVALACLSCLRAEETTPLKLPGTDSADHAPLAVPPGKKGVVLFFVSAYCPASNNFVPEMNRIAAEYGDSFQFYFVHSDKDLKPADVLQHTELNTIKATVLMDAEQKLAKREHAKTTPEAVVAGPDGKTLYQGRINDLYLTPTKRQRTPTTKDLCEALDAIKTGKTPSANSSPAVGCRITGVE